jgi:hypothetical protein
LADAPGASAVLSGMVRGELIQSTPRAVLIGATPRNDQLVTLYSAS